MPRAISEISKEVTQTTPSSTPPLCNYILKIATLISKVLAYPDPAVSSTDQSLNPNLSHRSAPCPATDNLAGMSFVVATEVEQFPEAAVYMIDCTFVAAGWTVLIPLHWLLLPV